MAIGAPKGNQNGRKAKDWERALRKALAFYTDKEQGIQKGEALGRIAAKVVSLAVGGDLDCIQEIANRLDGKPAQHIEGTFTHAIVAELSDEQLLAIASGSSEGVADSALSETDAPELH
jgi:hypothetical protein